MDNIDINVRLFLILDCVEPGKVYHGKMWLVRPSELDAENVFVVVPCTGWDSHGRFRLLRHGAQALHINADPRLPVFKTFSILAEPVLTWDDGHLGVRLETPAKDQLGRETRTETVSYGERHTGDGLEDGALPRRLVSADNNLGQVNITTNSVQAEFVDDVQEISVISDGDVCVGHSCLHFFCE
ncbi:hypothetical protein HG530_010560 [Fusarium avenaceum]|nr:hypothetical protein HG530_010560 [Fusarium avenaceum]